MGGRPTLVNHPHIKRNLYEYIYIYLFNSHKLPIAPQRGQMLYGLREFSVNYRHHFPVRGSRLFLR